MSSCLKTHVFILIALALSGGALLAQDTNTKPPAPEEKPAFSPAEAQARRIQHEKEVENAAKTAPEITAETKKKTPDPIEITAYGENRFEGGMAYASGNVEVHYRDDVVYADEIAYDAKNKTIVATGNVRIYNGTQVFRADQATYSFEQKKILSSSFWSAQERIFFKGGALKTTIEKGETKYTISNGIFTKKGEFGITIIKQILTQF